MWSLVAWGLVAVLRPRLRRIGTLSLVLSLGLVAGSRGTAPDLSSLDPDGPVVVEGRVASHVRGVQGEEWLWLRVSRIEQRNRVVGDGFAGEVQVLVGLPDKRPAEVARPAWGDVVRLKGYLRTSPPLDNGAASRPAPWRLNLPSWRFWTRVAPPVAWQRAASRIRDSVDSRLRAAGQPAGSGREASLGVLLRQALIVGSPDQLPESLRRRLRATGLSHLLAVSGLHLGLLAGWLWLVSMPLGRRLRLVVALLGVTAYLLLVGPKASALRAAGMAVLLATALMLRRPPQALNAAAFWATLLALWEPQILGDLGYQLSVSATVGILAFGPGIASTLELWARRGGAGGRSVQLLCQGLGVSLAAQLSTLPFLAPWTGMVHPAAPVLNLLAIPWLTVFLGTAFLSVAATWWFPSLDAAFVGGLEFLASPLVLLVEQPPSSWTTLPVSMSVEACLLLVTCFLAVLLRPSVSCRILLLLLVASLQGGTSQGSKTAEPVPGALEFVRLDVGQGDALLLRDGPRTLLVDGGGWRRGDIAARALVPALARHGVRRLDAVLLTHPDTDHCGGLVDLARYLEIAEIWSSPGWEEPCALELLTSPGPAWRSVWRGDHMRVGRWDIEILWPPPEPSPRRRRGEANDRSSILRASGGRHRILLSADVGSATERPLLRLEGERLRSTILGVGHHGSKTSTSAGWLEAASPRLATIGVGARNAYGHPHPTVLGRLNASGVRVHRTDLQGALHLRLDPTPRDQASPDGERDR